jgi:hypothetical protein
MRSLFVLSLVLGSTAPAIAMDFDDTIGGLGYGRVMAVQGVYGTGERLDFDGAGYSIRFDLAAFAGRTALGNLAGYEFFAEMGYERFGPDDAADDFTLGPILFDMGLGFPISLFELGSGGMGSFRLSLAPGIGFSVQEAYAYARGRIGVVVLPKTLTVDASIRYTPFEASYAWDDHLGLDSTVLQVAAQWTLDDEYAISAFVEWTDGEAGKTGQGDPSQGGLRGEDPLAPIERAPFQGLVRVGAGLIW